MNEGEKLLTFKEAYKYLRVSRSTLIRFMKRGDIAYHKVGHSLRFYKKDLREVVKAVDVNGMGNQVEPIDTEGD